MEALRIMEDLLTQLDERAGYWLASQHPLNNTNYPSEKTSNALESLSWITPFLQSIRDSEPALDFFDWPVHPYLFKTELTSIGVPGQVAPHTSPTSNLGPVCFNPLDTMQMGAVPFIQSWAEMIFRPFAFFRFGTLQHTKESDETDLEPGFEGYFQSLLAAAHSGNAVQVMQLVRDMETALSPEQLAAMLNAPMNLYEDCVIQILALSAPASDDAELKAFGECVQLLERHGADIQKQNACQQSAADLAELNGKCQILPYLAATPVDQSRPVASEHDRSSTEPELESKTAFNESNVDFSVTSTNTLRAHDPNSGSEDDGFVKICDSDSDFEFIQSNSPWK